MPEKILGIDISEDAITAVHIKSGFKEHRISACARVMIDENGGLEHALKTLSDHIDLKSDICIASIPEGQVSYRNLEMPFKDLNKIRQILPFEIEAISPFPIEDLILDFTVIGRSEKKELLAASVRKAIISKYLAHLQSHGIDPDVLDIRCMPTVSRLLRQEDTPDNGLVMDIDEKSATMVLYIKRCVALIRTFVFDGGPVAKAVLDGPDRGTGDHIHMDQEIASCLETLCTKVQDTIFAYALQNNEDLSPEMISFTGIGALYANTGEILTRFFHIPARRINIAGDKKIRPDHDIVAVWNPALMDGALALALRDGKQGRGFDFRRDEFETKTRYLGLKKSFKKAAALLGIVFFFLTADMGMAYHNLKKRHSLLDQQIMEVFKQTFPNIKKTEAPIKQMQIKINTLRKSGLSHPGADSGAVTLGLLKEISMRLPKSLDTHMTRMLIDPETVRISGTTDTFNTVDNIKNGLEASSCFSSATISSANLDRTGNQVKFEVKLQRSGR